ncbi:hypothetical protein Bhyg_04868, partial [Pseudolycoriella hygida]
MDDDSVIFIDDSYWEENSEEEMESTFKLPESLVSEGSMDHNWKIFKRDFQIYLTASEKNKKSPEVQAAIFLNMVGDFGRQLHSNFNMTAKDSSDIVKLMEQFEEFCAPKKNVVYERFKLNQRCQKEGENFDSFLTDIQKLIRTCEYGEEEKNALRDRIVIGIRDSRLQEKLLAIEDITSEKAITLCRAAELAKSQAKEVQGKNNAPPIRVGIDAVMENKVKKCGNGEGFDLGSLSIGSVGEKKLSRRSWYEPIVIEKVPVTVKVDTGADVQIVLI